MDIAVNFDRTPNSYSCVAENVIAALKGQKINAYRSAVGKIVIHKIYPDLLKVVQGAKNVAMVSVETTILNREHVSRLNAVDEIWAESLFVKNVLISNGVMRPIICTGVPIDCGRFAPAAAPEKFVIGVVSTWDVRKNVQGLLSAFAGEFSGDEATLFLQLDVNGSKARNSVRKQIQRIAPVGVVCNFDRAVDMPALYRGFSVLASASHAEGFGLANVEAMACGVPVVSVPWGGPADYMNDATGFVLPYAVVSADAPYVGNWASIAIPQIRKALRAAKESFSAKRSGASAFVREKYDYTIVAPIMLERIRALLA